MLFGPSNRPYLEVRDVQSSCIHVFTGVGILALCYRVSQKYSVLNLLLPIHNFVKMNEKMQTCIHNVGCLL